MLSAGTLPSRFILTENPLELVYDFIQTHAKNHPKPSESLNGTKKPFGKNLFSFWAGKAI
jgi:hypothetical protein